MNVLGDKVAQEKGPKTVAIEDVHDCVAIQQPGECDLTYANLRI